MYSDPEELAEEELEGEEDEMISTGTGRAILRLGAELVMLDCLEEDIKERKRELTSERRGILRVIPLW